jgi:chorismate-pyruvate lyase
MSGAHAPVTHSELAEAYVAKIEAHLVRLAQGRDPLGHLFAMERLARAARAEWWEAARQAERRGHGR